MTYVVIERNRNMKKLSFVTLSSAVLLLTACAAQTTQTTSSSQVAETSKVETTQMQSTQAAETTQAVSQASNAATIRVDVEEVQETVGLYLVTHLGGMKTPDSVTTAGLMYLTNPDETDLVTSEGLSVYEEDLADVVDAYNEVFSGVYNEADVLNYLKKIPDGLTEDPASFDDDRPLNRDIRIGELVYYAGNKKLVMALGGVGGAGGPSISQPNQWVQQNGQLIVPIIATVPGQKNSEVVLELNQKAYTGGKERSLYTIVR